MNIHIPHRKTIKSKEQVDLWPDKCVRKTTNLTHLSLLFIFEEEKKNTFWICLAQTNWIKDKIPICSCIINHCLDDLQRDIHYYDDNFLSIFLSFADISAAVSYQTVVVRAGLAVNLTCPGTSELSLVSTLEWRCQGCNSSTSPSLPSSGRTGHSADPSSIKLVEYGNNAVVVWHNRERMSLDTHNYALRFDPVRISDHGEYSCLVNERRRPEAIVHLVVQGKRKGTYPSPLASAAGGRRHVVVIEEGDGNKFYPAGWRGGESQPNVIIESGAATRWHKGRGLCHRPLQLYLFFQYNKKKRPKKKRRRDIEGGANIFHRPCVCYVKHLLMRYMGEMPPSDSFSSVSLLLCVMI